MLNSRGLAQRGDCTSAFGDFRYDQVSLMTAEELVNMFLPYMHDDAWELIDDSGSEFVEAQFLFYGVEYTKAELKGNGVKLLQKKLTEGKLDRLPDHIQKLKDELHMEWLESMSPEGLVGWPDFALQKYFVDQYGNPEPTQPTSVIAFPFRGFGEVDDDFCNALGAVPGLCYAPSAEKLTVYVGWSKAEVQKAAGATVVHVGKKQDATSSKSTNTKRYPKHEKFLKKIKNYTEGQFYPEGRYVIDSAEIEKSQCGEIGTRKFSMAIRLGPAPDWFTATFDFGIIEGMMVMAPEKGELDRYCGLLDREVDAIPHCGDSDCDHLASQDDEDDDDEEDIKPHVRSKRKASAGKKTGAMPNKKVKKTRTLDFFIHIKCRETEQGEIVPHAHQGILKFDGPNYASFTAVAGLPYIGNKVVFKGRKISEMVRPTHLEWSNFSQIPAHWR
ncbi:hypothetical protein QBC37DRAFT_378130 [Rhypophila decipiens]|uniref:Uncharacterized protein n=1 Tax=Rhypophila decipiens TaxID=261697 RepID=A0AAN6XZ53_9PEZI|nr:hypothetical protein QBC37DRAFT_378130 [Rhypophila decipiens]